MSGGSYDYLGDKMEHAARKLLSKDQCAYRRAFGDLMRRCALAMRDVEWVDSDDYGIGDDEESIMECIRFSDILAISAEEAERCRDELDRLIKLARGKK